MPLLQPQASVNQMEPRHMRSQFRKILDHLDSQMQWIYPKLQMIVELMNAFLFVVNVFIGDLNVAFLSHPKDV